MAKDSEKKDEDQTVSFRVFMTDAERTEFKIACAREKTSMSAQAAELIRQWLKEHGEQ